MENERFDALARTLAGAAPPRTRRGTLGVALGGVLGGLVATREGAAARARRARATAEQKKKTRGKNKKKKDKKDEKTCGKGEDRCNGDCVNLQADRNNCGFCGRACTEQEECLNGGCFGCADPLSRCGDECFDLTSSNQHCGGCGIACGENEQCINGFCTCAGPRCLKGNGERRCCPATGGTCCAGSEGTCCPAGQFCTQFAGCCPIGTYACADGIHCCPNGLTCRGDQCTLR